MADVERYRKPTRILHFVHLAMFIGLAVTGSFLYFHAISLPAQDGWSRLIHRIFAVIFVLGPLIYMVARWKTTWKGIKDAFHWTAEDIGWLKAAPAYYFMGDESAMPPQEHMNVGQKLYWLIVLVSGVALTITGALMWFFKGMIPSGVFQWSVFAHDVFAIAVFTMFLLHIYLSVIHPLMAGVIWSMIRGTVPADYAKSHHRKWYEKIARGQAK